MTRHEPRVMHVSTATACPRCTRLNRVGSFLVQQTLLDGEQAVLAAYCRVPVCGYAEIIAMTGPDHHRAMRLRRSLRQALILAMGFGGTTVLLAALLVVFLS